MAAFHRAGREDIEATKNVNRERVRRRWRFTQAYRAKIGIFVLIIAASALLGILPPLLFKRIIDHAIPNQDRGQVATLALITVGIALASVALDIAQRWYSAMIGESVIFDL